MENRVVEFGYSSNLGGVEVFIRNIIMNTSTPIDLVVTTQDKIPFEDDFVTKGSRIFRIPSRRSAPSEYKRNIENVLRDHPEIKVAHVHLNSCSSIEALEAARKSVCGASHTATVPTRISTGLQGLFILSIKRE